MCHEALVNMHHVMVRIGTVKQAFEGIQEPKK